MLAASSAAALPLYTVTDLGSAAQINNEGQVIGGNVLWDPTGGITVLPGTAIDIDNHGRVLGDGWVWDATVGVTALPADVRNPRAMNDLGQIVGQGPSPTGGYNGGYLWDPVLGFTPIVNPLLGGPPTGSGADVLFHDLDNLGRVVGTAAMGEPAPAYWDPSLPAAELLRTQSGALAGSATAVNDRGQIVAAGLVADPIIGSREGCDGHFCRKAIVWDDPTAAYVIAAGAAYDINDSGWVVGSRDYCAADPLFCVEGYSRAFAWNDLDGLVDLSSLVISSDPHYGTSFLTANAINNNGWILADNRYLLRPVPEPTTVSMLVVGLLALCVRRRRNAA
ncbi:MAG TPA: PEP-CTERM sorting domain-containing protein [Gammaproteobacteria bacterium]|nr:PEP-CTERM sorting domain-containing protein [Gammaproteobacteria bacterium]